MINIGQLLLIWGCTTCTVYSLQDGELRLTGQGAPLAGQLEIYHSGRWGTICDDSFDQPDAEVACRQLGYPTVNPNITCCGNDKNISVWLDEMDCTGRETTLASCRHPGWGATDCGFSEHVSIACAPNSCNGVKCLHAGTCVRVSDTQHRCNCPPNYTGNLCQEDVDECATSTVVCSHGCVNTDGSYKCSCPDAELELSSDNHTCYAPGISVACGSNAIEVEFLKQTFLGLHARYLTMGDRTCHATSNSTHISISVPLEGCGTTVQKTPTGFLYVNKVLTRPVPVGGLVSRVRELNLTIRCFYPQSNLAENFYVVNTGELHFTDHGQGTYQINMNLIHNGNVFKPTGSLPLKVEPGENLSVKLSLYSNDSHLQVFARHCKATSTPEKDSGHQYLILDNGCANDTTLTIRNASDLKQETLSIESFRFVDNSSRVYLHCEVLVCNALEPNSRCLQGCLRAGRRKRNSGTYLASQSLTVGPIELEEDTVLTGRDKNDKTDDLKQPTDPESGHNALVAGLALFGVVLVMTTVVISIITKKDNGDL